MEDSEECPVCGSKEIRQGRQVGEARIYPIKLNLLNILKGGSNVIGTICSDCGHIFSMKVESPQDFK